MPLGLNVPRLETHLQKQMYRWQSSILSIVGYNNVTRNNWELIISIIQIHFTKTYITACVASSPDFREGEGREGLRRPGDETTVCMNN